MLDPFSPEQNYFDKLKEEEKKKRPGRRKLTAAQRDINLLARRADFSFAPRVPIIRKNVGRRDIKQTILPYINPRTKEQTWVCMDCHRLADLPPTLIHERIFIHELSCISIRYSPAPERYRHVAVLIARSENDPTLEWQLATRCKDLDSLIQRFELTKITRETSVERITEQSKDRVEKKTGRMSDYLSPKGFGRVPRFKPSNDLSGPDVEH